MKKNSKKVKYRSNNNGLEEPLREIIELNICNLSFNIKRNIMKRAEKERKHQDYISEEDTLVDMSLSLNDNSLDNSNSRNNQIDDSAAIY